MRRREFLSQVGVATVGAVAVRGWASTTRADRESDGSARLCGVGDARTESDHAAFAPLTDEPDFVVSATSRDDVRVHWQDPRWFADQGESFAVGISNVNGRDVALNPIHSRDDWLHILMHELAHSLGYDHGDEGVVSLGYGGAGDLAADEPLAESTAAVAEEFDGFRHCEEWTITDLSVVASDFSEDETGMDQLAHAAARFSADDPPSGCYFADGFDELGGQVRDPKQGHFYGWPALSETP